MNVEFSRRDREILWTLTRKVRVLSVGQIGRTWWSATTDPAGNARKRVRELERAGVLSRITLTAHPEINLNGPQFLWSPGSGTPNFGAISYRLRKRWSEMPVPTPAAIATKLATRIFGGHIADRKPRPSEATHDLHLSQVFLHFLNSSPKLARAWTNEDQLYKEGRGRNERLPDAVLRLRRGKETVIEFGGAYSKSKLADFHKAMHLQPYELW